MLEVRLYKPAVYKLKILGKGKIEYYKAIKGTKKKGGNQIFKVQWGKKKWGEHDFWLRFSGGKRLGGNYDMKEKKSIFSRIEKGNNS